MKAELIPFPKNKERFFQLALDAYHDVKLDEARQYLEKIPIEDMDIDMLYIYVSILFQLKYVDKAFELAEPREKDFLKNESSALTFSHLLIHKKQYFRALGIIIKYIDSSEAELRKIWRVLNQHCQKMLAFSNMNSNGVDNKKIRQYINNKVSDEGLNLKEQARLIDHLYQVSREEQLELATNLLLRDDIYPIIRRYALEFAVVENLMAEAKMLWFDEVKRIDLTACLTFEEQPIFNDIEKWIDQNIIDEQPDLEKFIWQTVNSQLLFLYPCIEEVVVDLDFWMREVLRQIEHMMPVQLSTLKEHSQKISDNKLSEEEQMMLDWFERLSEVILNNHLAVLS